MIVLDRWGVSTLVDFFEGPCRFDHDGACQAHTVDKPCPVAALRAALEDPS